MTISSSLCNFHALSRAKVRKINSTAICLVLLLCSTSTSVFSSGTDTDIESGFSPDGSGEALVLRSINSAHQSIRLAAYSFTAAPVVSALVAAKKRGVDVAILVDYKNNIKEDRTGKAKAALNLLVNAGIPTRTVSVFRMQHSKYAVVDSAHIQTGSYNYSASAARYNSENVLVIWNRPKLARQYLDNWQILYSAGQAYTSTY